MSFLHIILFLVALLGASALSAYAQKEIAEDLVITLERTPCFGWCPAYSLTITAKGGVTFTPTGGFVVRGNGVMPSLPLTRRITADQVRSLISEFEEIKFYSLRNRYGRAGKSSGGSSCPTYWTDSPMAYVSFVRSGRRKTVSHYLGCTGAKILDDLEALENNIDRVAKTEEWTSQFGWGAASVHDVKLQVHPANSSKPDKP